jgi:DNA-binding transcriptional ArsR family regulator
MQEVYHPNAWFSDFRNVKAGLERRTSILRILEQFSVTANQLSERIDVTYSTILYHLHNLESRGIVEKADVKPPYIWLSRSVGQQTLNNYPVRRDSGILTGEKDTA